MSEFAPPHESGDAPVAHQEALTPQAIEAVLADFRSWLEQAAAGTGSDERGLARAAAPASPALIAQVSEEPLDLHTLLGQFVALRHEVNLQTKATRAQQEQNADALASLEKALEILQDTQAAPPTDENLRPLLKTLVDLHDNLSLARREVQRTQEVLQPLLEQLAGDEVDAQEDRFPDALSPDNVTAGSAGRVAAPAAPRMSWWSRWFGGSSAESTCQVELMTLRRQAQALETWHLQAREAADRALRLVTSLSTGYTMSLNRVERALQQSDLEALPTIGMPFDPETMEVLEVVHEVGRTTTEVIEEVRRGYLWRGRLLRFAQVRVARPLRS